MAIITFWNDNTGKTGQTYSALAIAMHMGIEHNYKTLLMSTRYGDGVTMQAIGTTQRSKTLKMLTNGKKSMDLESGIEGMAKLASASRLSPDMVPNYTKVILKDRLEVVVAPSKKTEVDYNKIYSSCKDILNVARKHYDIVFVDLNNGLHTETTKEILRMSDIIIMNIEQKPKEMKKLIELREDAETFNPKRILTLINNYDRKSKYSTKNISREIGEKKEVLSIPYCNLYMEAVQEGTAPEFFLGTRVKRLDGFEDRTSFFIHEVDRAVKAIIYKLQELQMTI